MENVNIETERISSLKRKVNSSENTTKNTTAQIPNLTKMKYYADAEKTYFKILDTYSKYFECKLNERLNTLNLTKESISIEDLEEQTIDIFNELLPINDIEFWIDEVSEQREDAAFRLTSSLCNCKNKDYRLLKVYAASTRIHRGRSVYIPIGENISVPKKTRKYRYNLKRGRDKTPMKVISIGDLLAYLYMCNVSYKYLKNLFNENEENSYVFFNADPYTINNVNSLIKFDLKTEFCYPMHSNHSGVHLIAEAFAYIIEEEYNIELDLKYNENMKSDYAKSYMYKKNIPDKIKLIMNDNEFLTDFSSVELDSETDLIKFNKIQQEFKNLKMEVDLPKLFSNKSKPDLKFRKLGQHKALGLYYPSKNCICIDIKSPSSLAHEIGHCIDYTFTGNNLRLSSKKDFLKIVLQYKNAFLEELDNLEDMATKRYLNNKKSYYFNQTEIFARMFEFYLAIIKKMDSSFLKLKSGLTIDSGYPNINKFLHQDIEKYFDLLFKKMDLELTEGISTFINNQDLDIEIQPNYNNQLKISGVSSSAKVITYIKNNNQFSFLD